MRAKIFRYVKIVGALLGVSLLTFLAVRIYLTQGGDPLKPWHTFVPHELTRPRLDGAGWRDYLAAEDKIFAEVKKEVSQRLDRRTHSGQSLLRGQPGLSGRSFAQD